MNANHSDEYQRHGYTVIENVVPNPSDFRNRILDSALLRDVYTPQEQRVVAAGEGFNLHRALDRFETDATIPSFEQVYRDVLALAHQITGLAAKVSPFRRSAYYVKVYEPPQGQQGWHFDTNDISGVLYLTSHADSGATIVTALDGTVNAIQPTEGNLLLLQGTKCWHRANAVLDKPKVTALLNYYVGTPEPRHPKLDEIIFGTSESDPRFVEANSEARS